MNELLKSFCMGEAEAIKFLEETLKAQEIIDELTGLAQTEEFSTLLNTAYGALDRILSPLCPICEIRAKRFITSPAQLFDPDMANYPGGSTLSWGGEWYCPECRKVIAFGKKWWVQNPSPTKETKP